MSDEINWLITILCGDTLLRCAFQCKRDSVPGDCIECPLEPENRAKIHAMLPDHVRALGSIVAVEELFNISSVELTAGEFIKELVKAEKEDGDEAPKLVNREFTAEEKAQGQHLRGPANCKHGQILTDVKFNFLEDTGKYCADVRISCSECGEKFRFIGLPVGVNLSGATVSVDGLEARLAVVPESKGELPLGPPGEVSGFSIKVSDA